MHYFPCLSGHVPNYLKRSTHRSCSNVLMPPLSLSHPMLPNEGVLVDAETHQAFQTLVQWGYLVQPKQYENAGYVVTEGGLSYAAHIDGGLWDGTERRQPQRTVARAA